MIGQFQLKSIRFLSYLSYETKEGVEVASESIAIFLIPIFLTKTSELRFLDHIHFCLPTDNLENPISDTSAFIPTNREWNYSRLYFHHFTFRSIFLLQNDLLRLRGHCLCLNILQIILNHNSHIFSSIILTVVLGRVKLYASRKAANISKITFCNETILFLLSLAFAVKKSLKTISDTRLPYSTSTR